MLNSRGFIRSFGLRASASTRMAPFLPALLASYKDSPIYETLRRSYTTLVSLFPLPGLHHTDAVVRCAQNRMNSNFMEPNDGACQFSIHAEAAINRLRNPTKLGRIFVGFHAVMVSGFPSYFHALVDFGALLGAVFLAAGFRQNGRLAFNLFERFDE